jgi:hypothetical protein
LRQSAGDFQPQLAQGAAFAAKARLRAGNLTPQTELAVTLLCDRTAKDAAQLTDAALENLPGSGAEPNYEVWRCRVQTRLTAKKEIKG